MVTAVMTTMVITGLSLSGRGWEFLLVTMNMAPGLFHRKVVEEK